MYQKNICINFILIVKIDHTVFSVWEIIVTFYNLLVVLMYVHSLFPFIRISEIFVVGSSKLQESLASSLSSTHLKNKFWRLFCAKHWSKGFIYINLLDYYDNPK